MGLPLKSIQKLQFVQNAAGRMICADLGVQICHLSWGATLVTNLLPGGIQSAGCHFYSPSWVGTKLSLPSYIHLTH